MNRNSKYLLLCIVLIITSFEVMNAEWPKWRPKKHNTMAKADKVAVQNQFTLTGNNWAFEMTNYGPYAQDVAGRLPNAGGAGGEFPRGTGTYIIFAAGLQIGALVNGVPKVSVIDFDSEFQPGAVVDGVPTDPGLAVNKLFALYKDGSDGTPVGTNGDGMDDYANWPRKYGAPVKSDGTTPLVIGDLMSWCVYNDLDKTRHTIPDDSQKDPLGLEVQQASIQVNITGYSDVFFMYWKIINKGTTDLTNVYTSGWFDADVDNAGNDLVATDTSASMVFTYNADNSDPVSAGGSAFGADFFQGPVVPGTASDTAKYLELTQDGFVQRVVPGKKVLGLSATIRYINVRGPEGDPDNDAELYNLMQGKEKNSDPKPGKFTFPADPITAPAAQLDPRPDDKRMMLCTGPFNLAVGDTQVVVLACVGSKGTDRLNAIANLRATDVIAQQAYNAKFLLPQPPPSPKLTATALSNKVVLQWDNSSEVVADMYPQLAGLTIPGYAGFDFAGYKLYRSPSGTLGSWTMIGHFDKKDGITEIPETTWVVQDQSIKSIRVVSVGDDKGLQYSYTDTDVKNGQSYYYAVTAYDAQPGIRSGSAPVSLEGNQSVNAVKVTPQPSRLGYQYVASSQDTATYFQIDNTKPVSDGSVLTSVVDPTKVKNNNIYKVTFNPDLSWNLYDSTASKVLLSNWTNQGGQGENAFRVFDGVLVKVLGPALAAKDVFEYSSGSPSPLNPSYTSGRWFTGTGGAGGEAFFEGVFLGPNFQGSTVPAGAYPAVELLYTPMTGYTDLNLNGKFDIGEPYTFDTTATSTDGRPLSSKAFMYRTFGPGNYRGFYWVPFSAWNIDATPPKQLNVIVRDRNTNNQWELHYAAATPDPLLPNSGDAQYQYTWIMASNYDPAGTTYNPTAGGVDHMASNGGGTDSYYTLWLSPRGTRPFLAEGASFKIFPNRVNTANDVFVFKTTSSPAYNAARAAQQLNKNYIKVVPNPYYGFSAYDQNQFNRRVKITGLPNDCTIRIFNIAGDLVRTIRHNGTSNNERSGSAAEFTSVETWDLTSDNGIFVSSGVYFMYIDAPGIGKSEELIPFAIIQGSVQLTVPTN